MKHTYTVEDARRVVGVDSHQVISNPEWRAMMKAVLAELDRLKALLAAAGIEVKP